MCSSPPTAPPPPPRGFHTPMDPPHAPTSCSGRYTCTHGSYTPPRPAQKPCPNPCTPNTCLAVLIRPYPGGEYNLHEHAPINTWGGGAVRLSPGAAGASFAEKMRGLICKSGQVWRRGTGGAGTAPGIWCVSKRRPPASFRSIVQPARQWQQVRQ